MMRNVIVYITLTYTLLLALSGCGKKEPEVQAPAEKEVSSLSVILSQKSISDIGIKTETVNRKPFSHSSAIPAKVISNQDNEALVGSLVQGRVCKVFVKAGDYVKAGQQLMLVEGLEIGEIKAGFLSAKANLAYQTSNLERQKKLIEEKIGAQKNLLETQNEYDKALAEYQAEENRINAIGLRGDEVSDTKTDTPDNNKTRTLAVRSPLSGIVVERNVVIGQLLESSTNAFRIINLSTVWVDGQIYEKDIDKIKNNAAALFHAAPYPQEQFKGTIIYIGQVIDEKTRTLTVRAEFKNSDSRLKPQMFGELTVVESAGALSIVVPAEALVKIDNADYVFIQKDDSTFEKRALTIGIAEQELVEIVSGIQEGERVVTKGAFYLKSELLKAAFGGEE
jgi:cobalt-zinc-cadmium efflux system membrane fusion protein